MIWALEQVVLLARRRLEPGKKMPTAAGLCRTHNISTNSSQNKPQQIQQPKQRSYSTQQFMRRFNFYIEHESAQNKTTPRGYEGLKRGLSRPQPRRGLRSEEGAAFDIVIKWNALLEFSGSNFKYYTYCGLFWLLLVLTSWVQQRPATTDIFFPGPIIPFLRIHNSKFWQNGRLEFKTDLSIIIFLLLQPCNCRRCAVL